MRFITQLKSHFRSPILNLFKLPDLNFGSQCHVLIIVLCIGRYVAHIIIIYITTGTDMFLKEWFGNKTNELNVCLS